MDPVSDAKIEQLRQALEEQMRRDMAGYEEQIIETLFAFDDLVAELRQARERLLTERATHPNGACGCGGEGRCQWCQMICAKQDAEELRIENASLRASVADYQKHLGEIVAFGADAATLDAQLRDEIARRETAERRLSIIEGQPTQTLTAWADRIAAAEDHATRLAYEHSRAVAESDRLRAQLEEAKREKELLFRFYDKAGSFVRLSTQFGGFSETTYSPIPTFRVKALDVLWREIAAARASQVESEAGEESE